MSGDEQSDKNQLDLSDIAASLRDIKKDNAVIHRRLDNIEDSTRESEDKRNLRSNFHYAHEGATGGTALPSTGVVNYFDASYAGDIGDVQESFTRVRDSVSKVKLPKDYKLNDSRVSVNRKDITAFNILSKCARYSETAIKLLQCIPEPEEGSETKNAWNS